MASVHDIFHEIRTIGRSEKEKGDLFERFVIAYLQTDPVYALKIKEVWRYPDWPDRPEHWRRDNMGIDLVAKTVTGEYWAIQCKFYEDHAITKKMVTNFNSDADKEFTINGEKKAFTYRLFVSTLNKLGAQADEAIVDLPDFGIISLDTMELAPIDWSQFTWDKPEYLVTVPGKSLRDYQREAVMDVLDGFSRSDRGKLIMACGTGKTFTSLQIMQKMLPDDGIALFLAPSLTLVSQTLREWCDQANPPIHAFVVCSDSQVGREDEDIHTRDIAYPATTDPVKIVNAIEAAGADRRRVIFATYQSIQKVIEAQELAGLPAFDLVICDEAHRTTGLTIKGKDASEFVKVHRKDILHAKKRLYMTATPRIYGESTKSRAGEHDAVLYSMDDSAVYGPEFHVLTFGDAASRGILAEYKVVIVAVREEAMADIANKYNSTYKLTDKKGITAEFATRIIGAWKGLSKKDVREIDGTVISNYTESVPMKRAVAFANSIHTSKIICEAFSSIVDIAKNSDTMDGDDVDGDKENDMGTAVRSGENQGEESLTMSISLRHVDGTMGMSKRAEHLKWLRDDSEDGECRVLTNARCLSEGVDVPSLDAVIFFDARDSMVDIVQAVGRVMRKAEGKEYGYVILPVAIPSTKVKGYDNYIDNDPRFKAVWKVLKAIRAHDERLVDKSEYQRRMMVMGGDVYSSRSKRKGSGVDGAEDGEFDFPAIPLDKLQEALYAVVPKHFGDTEYWASWAKEVAQIAEKIIVRIEVLIEKEDGRNAFEAFLKAIRNNVNAGVSESEAIEMLAQHVLTKPIFDALFGGYSFSKENPVSQAMQQILDILDTHGVDSEANTLRRFYDDVAKRVSLAKSDDSRQDIIRNLYDTFFRAAFPDMAQRLGIVYTPVEVVDFILNSANDALQKHFGRKLSDENVQILDPFTGTGTFITRLLQSGLLDKESLIRKYGSEIHANEIVLLAYYIAAINIESAYHARVGEYRPFEGVVLADTFQMYESLYDKGQQTLDVGEYLQENSERAERQKQARINVVIGNPPYSAGQKSANDNNQNVSYPKLDERIRSTYAAQSSSKLLKKLYDSYVRAIRLASDRIGESGIVSFITNGSFMDGNAADGLRKCLTQDFSHVYVFNLRGFIRGKQGESAKREGQNIFEIMTGVAIMVLVKDPSHVGPCELCYHDIGDYLTRDEKLAKIRELGSIENISWQKLIPNSEADWLDQRNKDFDNFIPLGEKESYQKKTIFSAYSIGVVTARDAWAYNLSKSALECNMQSMIDTFNQESRRYEAACAGLPQDNWPELESVIVTDPKRISWTRSLKAHAGKAKRFAYEPESVTVSMYRPFAKQWLYFNRQFNEMVCQIPKLFPTPKHQNLVISATGIGSSKDFSTLVSSTVIDIQLLFNGQCFPLYWYESVEEASKKKSSDTGQAGLFTEEELKSQADEYGYIRHDAVTDWALQTFRERYTDTEITKEDIFWYVYGLLHSAEYRERFSSDLKKMLPRIPLAPDFWVFSNAGRGLGNLHLNYETVEPWPLEEIWSNGKQGDYHVDKIRFAARKTKDDNGKTVQPKDAIAYNSALTLAGIPEKAYEYVVNGKSAIEWIMERYSVRVDKDSEIVNDPNLWCEEHNDPTYIVNLIKRIVRVSVESVQIINYLSKKEIE